MSVWARWPGARTARVASSSGLEGGDGSTSGDEKGSREPVTPHRMSPGVRSFQVVVAVVVVVVVVMVMVMVMVVMVVVGVRAPSMASDRAGCEALGYDLRHAFHAVLREH